MGEAIWLYLWLLDKQTEPGGGILHGKIIPTRQIAADLEVAERTVKRWLKILLTSGYITDAPTLRGHVLAVTKPKKQVGHKCHPQDKVGPGVTDKGSVTCPSNQDKVVPVGVTDLSPRIDIIQSLQHNKSYKGDVGPTPDQFIELWNKTTRGSKILARNKSLAGMLKTRNREPIFATKWRDFVVAQGQVSWTVSFEWFLSNDEHYLRAWSQIETRKQERIQRQPERDPILVEMDADRARVEAERKTE